MIELDEYGDNNSCQRYTWRQRFWQRVYDCHVIWYARVQVVAGVLLTASMMVLQAISAVDLSVFFNGNPKYVAVYLIVNGLVTEGLRRYKAKYERGGTIL